MKTEVELLSLDLGSNHYEQKSYYITQTYQSSFCQSRGELWVDHNLGPRTLLEPGCLSAVSKQNQFLICNEHCDIKPNN